MSVPAKRAATYDDLAALPDNVVGEILMGELVTSPRPAGRHALASSALGGTLLPPFQFGEGGPGGWWILDEPELHFGDDVVVPDLAGWRCERMPEPPEDAFLTLAPDWLCEVLSNSTARIDRVRKLPVYARAGVPHCWLIDPTARTLEVYDLDAKRWVLFAAHGGDEIVRAAPFADVDVHLKRLWGQP